MAAIMAEGGRFLISKLEIWAPVYLTSVIVVSFIVAARWLDFELTILTGMLTVFAVGLGIQEFLLWQRQRSDAEKQAQRNERR
jgi:hypothetical protein